MIVIEHVDPQFVAIKDFVLNTPMGGITILETEPVSLCFHQDGSVCFGNDKTVLRITHKTALSDLLSAVRPADFNLVVEEDGEMSLVSTLKEYQAPGAAGLSGIATKELGPNNVIDVQTIRPLKE